MEKGRLSRTVSPEYGYSFAGLDGEIYISQRLRPVRICKAYICQCYQIHVYDQPFQPTAKLPTSNASKIKPLGTPTRRSLVGMGSV